jgi:preprotein translocase subunit SecG
MEIVVLVIHLFIAAALVAVVLLQKSEGGALGMGGGGGQGGGIFSARGAANALTRTTAFLAAGFFATSVLLGILASRSGDTVVDAPGGSAPAQQAPASGPMEGLTVPESAPAPEAPPAGAAPAAPAEPAPAPANPNP